MLSSHRPRAAIAVAILTLVIAGAAVAGKPRNCFRFPETVNVTGAA